MRVGLAEARAPGARVAVVNINSSHTFAEQVGLFASCELMVSVHGSQNANLMFSIQRRAPTQRLQPSGSNPADSRSRVL